MEPGARVGESGSAYQVRDTTEACFWVASSNEWLSPPSPPKKERPDFEWCHNDEARDAMLRAIKAVMKDAPHLKRDRGREGIALFISAVWEKVDKAVTDKHNLTPTMKSVVWFVKSSLKNYDCLNHSEPLSFS